LRRGLVLRPAGSWRVTSGFPRELARGSRRCARSTQRQFNLTQRAEGVPSGDHRAEYLTDVNVIGMCARAVAEARHVPQGFLGGLDHRSENGTARRFGERVQSRPDALKRIRQRLPHSPSDLCQGVGEIGFPVIAHKFIFSLVESWIQVARGQGARPTVLAGRPTPAIVVIPAQQWLSPGSHRECLPLLMARRGADSVDMKFEVAVLPVADPDRSKAFYQGLGWRLDIDLPIDDQHRIIQFTPPGSPASIQFGTGTTDMTAGSVQDLYLIVDDVEAARADLMSHGADVSDIWHGPGLDNVEKRMPGRDPDGSTYRSFATFADPDGNSFLLQEITERLPGRVWPTDVGALAELLHETAEHHGSFEKVAPPHDWWDWYAAYMDARQRGSSQEEASAAAGRYMADVKHVVV